MAIGAAELALEGELGGVEEPFAAAEGVDVLGSAEIDGRHHFVGVGVDDARWCRPGGWRRRDACRPARAARPRGLWPTGIRAMTVIGRSGEIVDERLSPRAHGLKQAGTSMTVTLCDPAVVRKIFDLSGVMATPQGRA